MDVTITTFLCTLLCLLQQLILPSQGEWKWGVHVSGKGQLHPVPLLLQEVTSFKVTRPNTPNVPHPIYWAKPAALFTVSQVGNAILISPTDKQENPTPSPSQPGFQI